MPEIVVLGEALIDAFAETGAPLRKAKTLHPRPGGAPANVAYALAGLGADAGFIGKVGDDDYGKWLIDLLHGKGVDTMHFVTDANAPTMLAVVALPSPTEQQFILYAGASVLLRVESLPREYIESANVFVYGGVTLAGGSREAALQAAQWARAAGRLVVFDVNFRPSLWPNLDDARLWLQRGVSSADAVKLNAGELELLSGTADPAKGGEALLSSGPQLICVSQGDQGAYYTTGAVSGSAPAMPADVVDCTGCGDAFVAGLALRLNQLQQPIAKLSQAEHDSIVAFANACGGLAAMQPGAMCDIPAQAEVERIAAKALQT